MSCGGSEAPVEKPASPNPQPGAGETQPADAPATPRDPACTGANLDLDSLAATNVCAVARTGDDLPASIEATVQSEADGIGGRPVPIHVQLHNSSDAPVDLFIDASCDFTNFVESRVITRTGQRIDRVGEKACEPAPQCTGKVMHVTLGPKGQANLHYPLQTRVALADENCGMWTGRPLQGDEYKLEIRVNKREPKIVKLSLQNEEYLSVDKCKAYAEDLAKLAEPNKSLRASVAAKVQAQCEKTPPTMKLVKCQETAKDEAALKKCRADNPR
jgi:hypothetical protein